MTCIVTIPTSRTSLVVVADKRATHQLSAPTDDARKIVPVGSSALIVSEDSAVWTDWGAPGGRTILDTPALLSKMLLAFGNNLPEKGHDIASNLQREIIEKLRNQTGTGSTRARLVAYVYNRRRDKIDALPFAIDFHSAGYCLPYDRIIVSYEPANFPELPYRDAILGVDKDFIRDASFDYAALRDDERFKAFFQHHQLLGLVDAVQLGFDIVRTASTTHPTSVGRTVDVVSLDKGGLRHLESGSNVLGSEAQEALNRLRQVPTKARGAESHLRVFEQVIAAFMNRLHSFGQRLKRK